MDNTTDYTNSTNGTFEGFTSNSGTPKSFWSGLLLPVLYLTILIGSLATFSSLYRRRQVAKAAQLENWFPPHRARDIYLSLLHLDPADASSESETKLKEVPDSLLKAALLRRALEDIRRIVQLRSSKAALQNLLQRGSVGDELWQRFLRAEQEMEAEVKDVAQEVCAIFFLSR
jgi:translocation protein SEC66